MCELDYFSLFESHKFPKGDLIYAFESSFSEAKNDTTFPFASTIAHLCVIIQIKTSANHFDTIS